MSLRRRFAVLEHQYDFDQSGDTRDRFGVANICFDAGHKQRRGVAIGVGEHFGEGLHFDRIAQRRARAMSFDVTHIVRRDSRLVVGRSQTLLLRLATGSANARRAAILVDRGGAEHRQHLVAIADRIVEPLEQRQSATLATDVAIRAGVERSTMPIGRQHFGVAEGDRCFGGQNRIHPPRQRRGAFATAETFDRQVNRYRRRTTCRVDRHTGAVQVEDVRHTVSSDRQGVARAHVAVDNAEKIGRVVKRRFGVVAAADANVDGRLGARHFVRRQASVFQRLPSHFEQQSLLGVDAIRFPRGDAEELRVELVNVLKKPATASVEFPSLFAGRVVEGVDIPAIGGGLAGSILAAADDLPIVGERRSPRQSARHADDGNRRSSGGRLRSQPLL